MARLPRVTILITAYNRPADLKFTIERLLEQDYPELELLVVDDASPMPLAHIVQETWPSARCHRNDRNLGLVRSRCVGFGLVHGEYVLVLDDDAALTRAGDIRVAVARMEREPELGVMTFARHDGPTPPACRPTHLREQYLASFAGGSCMMRAIMLTQIGGYREFYEYYAEEQEMALRAIRNGWRILLCPEVHVHHRVSPIGRSRGKILAYSMRNSMWTALIHMPFPRVLWEVAWKFIVGTKLLLREASFRWWCWSCGSFLCGSHRALSFRAPLPPSALNIFDVLRFQRVAIWPAPEQAGGATATGSTRSSFGRGLRTLYRLLRNRPRHTHAPWVTYADDAQTPPRRSTDDS